MNNEIQAEIERIKFTEKALLSSILIDNKIMNEANSLKVSDFYDLLHRQIFAILKEKHDAGEVVDLTDFNPQLRDYILELMDMPEGLVNHEKYIKEIKIATANRALKSRLNDILSKNVDYFESKTEILEFARNLERNVIQKFDDETIDEKEVVEEKQFFLKDFLPLPQGATTIISAKGGSGKSALALQLGLRAANEKILTLAWLSEDPKYVTVNRAKKIARSNKLSINNYLHFLYKIPFQITAKNGIDPLFYEFKATYKDYKIIILDPLIAFYGADENSNSDARRFMALLNDWAANEDKAIILIHHQTKYADVSIARGASAFTDAVRAQYSVKRDENDDRFVVVKLEKDNWGIRTRTFFGNEQVIQIWENNYDTTHNENQEQEPEDDKDKKDIPSFDELFS